MSDLRTTDSLQFSLLKSGARTIRLLHLPLESTLLGDTLLELGVPTRSFDFKLDLFPTPHPPRCLPGLSSSKQDYASHTQDNLQTLGPKGPSLAGLIPMSLSKVLYLFRYQ